MALATASSRANSVSNSLPAAHFVLRATTITPSTMGAIERTCPGTQKVNRKSRFVPSDPRCAAGSEHMAYGATVKAMARVLLVSLLSKAELRSSALAIMK
jgi:hypothetical protein